MKKDRFKAHRFQSWFGQGSWKKFLGSDELVIGVDVGKTAFYGAVTTRDTDDVEVIYFEQDQISEVVEKLAGLDFERCTLVIEPSGTYSDGLIEQGRQQGCQIIRINGEQVSNARTVFDGVPSLHDGKAAYLLSRLYLCGVGNPWKETSTTQRELRALVDIDELMERTQQLFVGPLEAVIARHWPELTDFFDLTRATLLELLIEFGTAQAVSAAPDRAEALMRRVGGSKLSQDKIEGVIESAHQTIGVAPSSAQTEQIKYIAGMLRETQCRARDVTRRIKEEAAENEATAALADFAGARTAVVLVGMLGELTEYDSPEQLEKAQGLNLCDVSTGQTLQQKGLPSRRRRISKRGPGRVRKMMYWLAMRMISPVSQSHCPIATAWYRERLRRNGGRAIPALVALMRKLVGALWWIARGKQYDGAKLFDANRLRRLGHL